MLTRFILAALAAAILISAPAEARQVRHKSAGSPQIGSPSFDVAAKPAYPTDAMPGTAPAGPGLRETARHRTADHGWGAQNAAVRAPQGQIGDPRPRAWCGWWLRQHLGVGDRAGNLARWWARYGGNAHAPAVGAIVVWPHHVGIITGRTDSGWVVKSGNDGHAVRERERSMRGAIAFRWPNGMASR